MGGNDNQRKTPMAPTAEAADTVIACLYCLILTLFRSVPRSGHARVYNLASP